MFFFWFKTFYSISYFLFPVKFFLVLVSVSWISFCISSVNSIHYLTKLCKNILPEDKKGYLRKLAPWRYNIRRRRYRSIPLHLSSEINFQQKRGSYLQSTPLRSANHREELMIKWYYYSAELSIIISVVCWQLFLKVCACLFSIHPYFEYIEYFLYSSIFSIFIEYFLYFYYYLYFYYFLHFFYFLHFYNFFYFYHFLYFYYWIFSLFIYWILSLFIYWIFSLSTIEYFLYISILWIFSLYAYSLNIFSICLFFEYFLYMPILWIFSLYAYSLNIFSIHQANFEFGNGRPTDRKKLKHLKMWQREETDTRQPLHSAFDWNWAIRGEEVGAEPRRGSCRFHSNELMPPPCLAPIIKKCILLFLSSFYSSWKLFIFKQIVFLHNVFQTWNWINIVFCTF